MNLQVKHLLAVLTLAIGVITSDARPSFAALNRRFDTGRLNSNQRQYVWSLDLIRLIRPELRDSLFLHRLSDNTSDDASVQEWSVRNHYGWPVRPRPEFLVPELNFVTAGEPEYIPTYEAFDGFDRLRIYVQSGTWVFESRLADFGSIWQPVATLSSGDVVAYTFKHDFHRREYRLIRIE
jgi:hypothetical protein